MLLLNIISFTTACDLEGMFGDNETSELEETPTYNGPTFTITLDYGYDSKTEDISLPEESIFELPIITREGHKFLYWRRSDSAHLAENESILVTQDEKYTAVWEKNRYTVIFYEMNESGNYVSNLQLLVNFGDKLDEYTPKLIDTDKYEFTGWYTDKNCTEPIATVPSHNCSVYAGYKPISNVNDGVGGMVNGRLDSRDKVYKVYDVKDIYVDSYASLYVAMNYCIELGNGSYITKDGFKLFENNEYYSKEKEDMLWHYVEGTSVNSYENWRNTFWSDVKDQSYITVLKNAGTGCLEPFANSWTCVSVNPNPVAGIQGTTDRKNASVLLEANATVDLVPQSGITQVDYKVELSKAMITPSYTGRDKAWAYVGFITADSYNNSHMGLRCDPETGDWYYYSGEVEFNSSLIEINDEVIMTSTWDSVNNCYRPDQDVSFRVEILKLSSSRIVHRLTITLSDATTYAFDYEYGGLSTTGTIRFTSGLDIEPQYGCPDYMCGAKFMNLVVTEAKGTIFDYNRHNYGANPNITKAGVYDLLNSNPMSAARLHTIIYTPSCVEYDFTTPGKDVYSYSFDLDNTNNPVSEQIQEVIDAIDNINSSSDASYAKELFDSLTSYQKYFVINKDKLEQYIGSLEEKFTCDPFQCIESVKSYVDFPVYEIEFIADGLWCGIRVFYEGKALTGTNVNFGDNMYNEFTNNGFFWDPDSNGWFLYNSSNSKDTYRIIYNSETNTLSAQIVK